MFRTLISLMLFMCFSFAGAQSKQMFSQTSHEKDFVLRDISPDGFKVSSFTGSYELKEQEVKGQKEIRVNRSGYVNISEPGDYCLPVRTELLEIPDGTIPIVKTISFEVDTIFLSAAFPGALLEKTKEPVTKSNSTMNGGSISQKNKPYSKSRSFVAVESLGVCRGTELGRLVISPFLFNEDKNILLVANELNFEVQFLKAKNFSRHPNKVYLQSPVYTSLFAKTINPSASFKNLPTVQQIKYVVVADPMYQGALQEFISWKRKKGFIVTEAYTNNPAVGSSTSSIKNYLQGLYNSAGPGIPAPSYIVFVGDLAQIPSFAGVTGNHVSDLPYAEYDGNGDFFPDVYYGRISVSSVSELNAVVNKVLQYERYEFVQDSFLTKASLIAGVDLTYGPVHANGQMNYLNTNYVNQAHGIQTNVHLYPYSANASGPLLQEINSGLGFVNYSGHGNASGWLNPSFVQSQLSLLYNSNRYPLMIANACKTAKFDVLECFGESLLRMNNGGALAYIGASNDTYWNEDFYWAVGAGTISNSPGYYSTSLGAFDCVYHDHGENYSNWAVSLGQMVQFGNLAVSLGSSLTNAHYYWEIYNLLGDPSLMPYMMPPQTMAVTHLPAIETGTGFLEVEAEANSLVALSLNGQLLASKYLNFGNQTSLVFPPVLNPDTLLLVITGQNRRPYIAEIPVSVTTPAYITLENVGINDSGNMNGNADFNENVSLSISIKNHGSLAAGNVNSWISTSDTSVILTNNSELIGDVGAGITLTSQNAFSFHVNPYTEDHHMADFLLHLSDSSGLSWVYPFSIELHAPVLEYSSYSIVDNILGNGDGYLDPGEACQFIVSFNNTGSAAATNVIAHLECSYPGVNVSFPNLSYLFIPAGGTVNADFTLILSPNVVQGSQINFSFSAQDNYHYVSDTISSLISIATGNYCIPVSTCGYGDEIYDFQLNTIQQSATSCSNDGYSDYCTIFTTLIKGSGYQLSASTNYSGQYLSMWIDLNNDLLFDTTERLIYNLEMLNTGQMYSQGFVIPANANSGTHRMRVRTRWGDSCNDACVDYAYGETHDYTVHIWDANPPFPSFSLGQDIEVCANDTFLLVPSLNGGYPPFSFLWNTGDTIPSLSGIASNTALYKLTVSTGNGYQLIDSVAIVVHPLPYVNLGNDLLIAPGQTVVLDAGVPNSQYFWSNGASSSSIAVDLPGSYSVTVTDMNNCTNSDVVDVIFDIPPFPNWNVQNTGINHTILVPNNATLTIDGFQLYTGDYVGVFYDSAGTLACAGYTQWFFNYTTITVWGDDPQTAEKDGMATNEEFKWKLWRQYDAKAFSAVADYQTSGFPNTAWFTTNGLSGLASLEGSSNQIQTIELPQGWSIFSSYITPEFPSFEDLFSSHIQQLVIVKDDQGNPFWPVYNVNLIGNLDVHKGYQINTSSAFNLEISGSEVDPALENIPVPMGWSIISYLRKSPGQVDVMLSPINNHIEILKDGNGNPYWPAWGVNTIGNLQPGQGYQLNMNQADTLVYPAN